MSGQERGADLADVADCRLAFGRAHADIRTGDSLRADAFPGLLTDAVLCNPPFADRDWGFEQLAYDPRWDFGQPARSESELAWIQHCLSHVRPGGLVVMLVPAAVNSRASGRRVRAELIRRGALRAVIALPSGVLSGTAVLTSVWVLRSPEGDPDPAGVLLVDVSQDRQAGWSEIQARVLAAWDAFADGVDATEPGIAAVVPAIELLDEAVDLHPARHLQVPVSLDVGGLTRRGREFAAALAEIAEAVPVPELSVAEQSWTTSPIGDLIRAGAISLHTQTSRLHVGGTGRAVLMPKDVVNDHPAGERLDGDDGDSDVVIVEQGDVVIPVIAPHPVARVIHDGRVVLGRQLLLLRPNPEQIDSEFLAGFLRSGQTLRFSGSMAGIHRLDVRRVPVPVLPLNEQRVLGELFARIAATESALHRATERASEYFSALTDGLAAGQLTSHWGDR